LVKGICPECKVRNGDDSEKELYKCPLCGREFCANHLDPKLAFFSARFNISKVKDRQYREELMKELNKENAHPCVPYTRKRLNELDQERRRRLEKISEFLDKSRIAAENRLEKEEIVHPQPHVKVYKKRRPSFFKKILPVIVLSIVIFSCGLALFTVSDTLRFYFSDSDFLHFHLAKISSSLHFLSGAGWLIVWYYIIPIPIPLSKHSLLIASICFCSLLIPLISYRIGGKKGLFIAILLLLALYFMSTEPERKSTRDFYSRQELIKFLQADNTDRMQYTSDFKCIDFSLMLIEHAKAAGYRIYFTSANDHAFCKAYIISERRWVNIEPQTDEIWIHMDNSAIDVIVNIDPL